jgi:hypothetical protein
VYFCQSKMWKGSTSHSSNYIILVFTGSVVAISQWALYSMQVQANSIYILLEVKLLSGWDCTRNNKAPNVKYVKISLILCSVSILQSARMQLQNQTVWRS